MMTFHLEGPWLSTIGKRKGKIKFASSEAKRKSFLSGKGLSKRIKNVIELYQPNH